MTKKELLELIKDLKDDDSIDEMSELASNFGSLDTFKRKIEDDKDFKSFIDSLKDKHASKSLETWKENNLSGLVDEKIKELYPEEDPRDTELAKLKQEMEEMKREATKEKLTNKALKIATEKNLPTDMVGFFIGEDEDSTLKNLETFEKTFTDNLEAKVKERLKDNSYTPPTGKGTDIENPYSSEAWSLTKQAELESKDPDKAEQLREVAEKGEDN